MKNLNHKLILLIYFILFLIFVILIKIYKDYIQSFFTETILQFGIIAIILLIITMDTIIQPFASDLILIVGVMVLGNTFYLGVIGGLASVLGGVLGYYIGVIIKKKKIKNTNESLIKGKKLYKKYGAIAIIIGALSPVPYSAVCWAAGICHMNFKIFLATSLSTRLPRFILMAYIGSVI
jgi:membrane protein YqaA with SNARE-associated domain